MDCMSARVLQVENRFVACRPAITFVSLVKFMSFVPFVCVPRCVMPSLYSTSVVGQHPLGLIPGLFRDSFSVKMGELITHINRGLYDPRRSTDNRLAGCE